MEVKQGHEGFNSQHPNKTDSKKQTEGVEQGSEVSKQVPETVVTVKGDGENEKMAESLPSSSMIYRVHDTPPVYMLPFYGMQQALICVAGSLTVPFLISKQICASELPEVRAQLLSITFFMSGVASFLQTTVGVRLPIIQGASFTFLPPIAAMMQLDAWKCPAFAGEGTEDSVAPWVVRMREIQGNLMLASVVQVVLGCTGVVGLLLRFIGPITVVPTIALIGLGFTSTVTDFAESHWGVAAFTASMILLFSLWLGRLNIPVPSYSKDKGCHFSRFPLFVVISVLLAVGLGWLLSFILTVTDSLPSNSTELAYRARTDINLRAIGEAPWFQFPYPLQFGLPTVSIAGFFGMFLATISAVLKSIGDYYAAARVSDTPSPPPHAINRGIAMEGFTSILSGLVGAGHPTISYSSNIAAIGITRVASRRAFQTASIILILFGVIGKFGAVMTLIPEAVIGGLICVLLGTLIAVGLSALSFVDMNSHRNVTIIGLCFMLGLAVPQWVNAVPGRINTGEQKVDQVLMVLLGTPMFVGGLLGALLDNIVPCSAEQRGITKWQQQLSTTSKQGKEDIQSEIVSLTYELPYVSKCLRAVRCCAYVPFLPSFQSFRFCRASKKNSLEARDGIVVGYENKTFEDEVTAL